MVSATFSGRSPLGCRGNSARISFTRWLPGVAAPVVAGMAGVAAFALANPPATALAAGQGPAHHSPAPPVASGTLLSAVRPAAHKVAHPATYTVKSGDTLSAIAKRLYKSPDYWPVLYWANHGKVRYANEIEVGQVLKVPARPARVPAPPSALGPAPAPAPASSEAASGEAAPAQAAPAQSEPAQATGTYSGGSGFQACVIAAESGGNSQVMNSSGHYGLYQFSSSTWAAYGGNPADFGNASVSEQNQVFDNAVAAGGASNWAPYDGC
jgi:LysM repeat protein